MRIAVISDTHASPIALRAVLADVERARADEVWHLGDAVDWGPDPGATIALLQGAVSVDIAGNHDLLVTGRLSRRDEVMFSQQSLFSSMFSRSVLSAGDIEHLSGLPGERVVEAHDVHLAHASPRDPVWEYVDSAWAANDILPHARASRVMVGHTHTQRIAITRPGGRNLMLMPFTIGTPLALEGRRAVLNPGSVGQPRDPRDPRARWMLWDTDQDTITMCATDYDRDAARALVFARDAPEWFADLIG